MAKGGTDGAGIVRVLGECQVTWPASDAADDAGGSARVAEMSTIQRRIVATLAAMQPASVDRTVLIDVIWGDEAPRTARAALHNQISRIRQMFAPTVIVTVGDGYALGLPTDLELATSSMSRAEGALLAGEFALAATLADETLALFRGEPFVELDQLDAVHQLVALAPIEHVRRRAGALHRECEVIRLRAAIGEGRLAWASVEAERMLSTHPGDEQRWALLAEVHERSGRRGEALGVIDRARRMLRDMLGLDPGPQLTAVLESIVGAAAARATSSPATVIGREPQLEMIDAAMRDGAFTLVRGESGAGISTVLAEVGRRVRRRGWRVAFTRCVANPGTPLADLAEILDDLGTSADPTFGLLNGFVSAIQAIAAPVVVLVVDDLHHAGPSTIAALRAAAASSDVRVVASADATADWIHHDHDQVIDLPPLDAAAVTELATALAGRELSPSTLQWLGDACGGNPALLEQLLHDTTGGDPGEVNDLHAQPGLADLVRRRVERLGHHARLAIEIAAVCGASMPTTLIERLVPSRGGLVALHAIGLLEPHGAVTTFRHNAVQRVVYADLAPGRRMEIHHSIGQELVALRAAPGLVAHHLLAAAPLDAAAAIDAARRAADEATRQGAHLEAADWLERAERGCLLIGPPDGRLRIELLIARGDALRLAGAQEHENILFLAADLAVGRDDPDLLADAAFALLQLGSTTESGRLESRAAELAELAMRVTADPERRALVSAAASLTYSMAGHPERCRGLFVEAERASKSSSVRRRVLPFAYLALGHPRDAGERARVADELLTLAEAAGDATALFEAWHLGFSVALQTADGPRARTSLDEMEHIVDTVGDVGRRWALLYCNAALAHLEDRLDEAERYSEAALSMFSPVSPSRAFATYGAQLIPIRLAQGRIAELTGVFESLVHDQPGVPAWHAALALAVSATDPSRADAHARTALDDVPEDFTWLAGHVIGARAAAAAGNPATVERYRERLLPWSGVMCWQGTCTYGPVDTPLALLAAAVGDDDAVRHHRDVAVNLARRLGGTVFEREHLSVGGEARR